MQPVAGSDNRPNKLRLLHNRITVSLEQRPFDKGVTFKMAKGGSLHQHINGCDWRRRKMMPLNFGGLAYSRGKVKGLDTKGKGPGSDLVGQKAG